MPKKETDTIKDALAKLEKIVSWFDERQEVDVEEGLKKVRDGAELIKSLKTRLKAVENEFQEIKKELASDSE